MPAYRLDLSYDGSGFHGFARQPDVRTVQEDLERALSTIAGRPVEIECAGRTDAGVHAAHQVVSFQLDHPIDLGELRRRIDGLVGPEIVILEANPAPEDFSARFDAVSRSYRYMVLGRHAGDPLRRHTVWHVPHELDTLAMDTAAHHFVGEHDFASFCRKAEGRTSVRTVLSAGWTETEPCLHRFDVTATAFCHQMVRSLVALCVEVGRGRVELGDVPRIMEARDRNAARGAAPPHGLVLWEVRYESGTALPPARGGRDR